MCKEHGAAGVYVQHYARSCDAGSAGIFGEARAWWYGVSGEKGEWI